MRKSAMRIGSGKIYSKSPNKSAISALSDITNNNHLKSQISSDKGDRITQLDSTSSKANSRISRRNQSNVDSYSAQFEDSPKYEEIEEDPDAIIRKLSCLNNVFKELRMLKEKGLPFNVIRSLSKIEDKFIGIEREILKSTHLDCQK